ncbi:UDP-N-acetylmuramoyl-tripeptide--D-alanyl-D-alanine ligase [Thermosporothrix hazakensis]|uniref:Multifunctional fusion protein n=1 Tax=Thermosporothrix hazakensis TaxID=644383 RepID=A0A326U430_THEHA|nr:alanine racemase [Thermosporothrix hazakensis]PZW26381.1 UDP-N-acetylmuramoyl-tripeptide--D-alanyl-D-alanine ligase [Thermosporothrix hazakensis]GCE48667.1 alanine racemase [Thermosporothrix hazakensis]
MIYLSHLLEATRGVLRSAGKQTQFSSFSHDTRQLLPGEMFVAVRGERGDGHDYLSDAVHKGAAGLLIEARVYNQLPQETLKDLEQGTIVVVEDTREALQQYASAILQRWKPVVIAVAGGVGKTSTKEAIATVLSKSFATFRSWQNYNDLLGIPLSLGRLEPQHEYAVLELGSDHPGELSTLCELVQPAIGVLTNSAPVQLQYFESPERLAAEFGVLPQSLAPAQTFLLNEDDTVISELVAAIPVEKRPRCIGFRASSIQPQVSRKGLIFSFQDDETGQIIRLESRLPGPHHVATMLIAWKIGRLCGMSIEEVEEGMRQVAPMPGRLFPLPGVYQSLLLDDTHNSSPASLQAGLHTLSCLSAADGKRIAVLGDMLSLGDCEERFHREAGTLVATDPAYQVDYLITCGERAALIAEAARQAGLSSEQTFMTATQSDAASIVKFLLESTPGEHTILIKGSEATRMEKVTELLMRHPEQAPELLVRQTPGWKQIVILQNERPTWVEIDLSAIGNNTRKIKEMVGPEVRVLISLKADAYGHGALKVARTVLHNGASMLGVATLSEAITLREAGIDAPILIFGYVPNWQMREAVRQEVTFTLYTREAAQALSRAAQALRKMARVHVKVDTGMGRLGIRSEQQSEIIELIELIRSLPGLELEGLYTHFASADAEDKTHAYMQLSRFQHILTTLDERQLRPPIVHASNSAATLSMPEARFDMVRPGIAIYGLDPSPEVPLPPGFRPALSFKTQVAQVKMIPAGEGISYGCTYITTRPTRVAVLPVGYADGFRRSPQNWGTVLIHGQEAPILGRVCMDQCIIDVTHIPQTRVGDEVVLIGKQGNSSLTAEKVAQRLGTINYEVVAEILARVPRVG